MLASWPVYSLNYYVSQAGDDLNSGLSRDRAFRTIQRAVGFVKAGDTVFVLKGLYRGFDLRDNDGTVNAPIVFMAVEDSVMIHRSGPNRDDGINIENADNIVVDGFYIDGMTGNGNGVRLVLSDNCIVRNCVCSNNAERGIFTGFTDDIVIEYNTCYNAIDEHGIYVSNSSDRPIVRFNHCYGNNNIGIHFNGDLSAGEDGIIHDAQIYGNIIHDNNRAAGINLDGVLGADIYNNLIYRNHFAQGIALFQQDGGVMTSNIRIYNNTIMVPSDGRWGILIKQGAQIGTLIFNNIIINDHSWRGGIAAEDVSGLTCDFNILDDRMSYSGDGSSTFFFDWKRTGLDENSEEALGVMQIFKDPPNDDYRLFSRSQAVDKGTAAVFQTVKTDLDGRKRPQGSTYDLGAYEYEYSNAVRKNGPIGQRYFYTVYGGGILLDGNPKSDCHDRNKE